ncbi:hypothetical protein TNCV_3667041 [Trichonephila clavipes]|nr:hypothetical protein TNCV_3667041 [Trichonephila clavipes]
MFFTCYSRETPTMASGKWHDIPAENSSGRSPLTDEKMPCLLRYDWSRPIIAESGRGKDWVDSKINDPERNGN